jgi:hypothetical protein
MDIIKRKPDANDVRGSTSDTSGMEITVFKTLVSINEGEWNGEKQKSNGIKTHEGPP